MVLGWELNFITPTPRGSGSIDATKKIYYLLLLPLG
jgi:hypothetical protein